MTSTLSTNAPVRKQRNVNTNPWANGMPDPRPVTDYAVAVSTVSGNTRITITLGQPCVVRTPNWAFISATDGTRSYAPTMKIVDNQTFYFEFTGTLAASVNTIEVPYQDSQVQNGQGGFVSPGGRWFRQPH